MLNKTRLHVKNNSSTSHGVTNSTNIGNVVTKTLSNAKGILLKKMKDKFSNSNTTTSSAKNGTVAKAAAKGNREKCPAVIVRLCDVDEDAADKLIRSIILIIQISEIQDAESATRETPITEIAKYISAFQFLLPFPQNPHLRGERDDAGK